jgi:hypothetical protein
VARLPHLRSRLRRRAEATGDFIADLGYGTRRATRRVGGWIGGAISAVWFRLPLRARQAAAIAIPIAALVALILFVPIPRVPCQIGARECAPVDDAAKLVPGDAQLYLHLNLHGDSSQYRQTRDFFSGLPEPQLVTQAISGFVPHTGKVFDLRRDLSPWIGGEAAVGLGGGAGRGEYLFAVSDRKKADEFLAKFAGKPKAKAKYRGTEIVTYGSAANRAGAPASAFVGDLLVLADAATLRRAVDLDHGRGRSLDDAAAAEQVRSLMPDQRAADVYVSRSGVHLLAGTGGASAQLDTFVDYGASKGFAAAAVAHDHGLGIELFSLLDRKRTKRRPSFFAALPAFHPTLAGELDPDAIAYLGIADPAKSAGRLLDEASRADPALARGFERFRKGLVRSGGVDPQKDLLGLFGGEAAIAVDPPPPVPHVTLVVNGVDEKKAITALARLQKPIVDAINPSTTLQAPVFQERSIGGVTARSLRLSPTVDLTYATFDGKLVVSTDPSGVQQVRSGKGHLAGTDLYDRTTSALPSRSSAVIFLNLNELFALAEQAGLAENPDYATFRDDIRAVKALALGVRGSDTELETNVFLNIQESK